MDRYLEVAYSATPPSAPAASSGYPTNGNPQTATPASEPGEWWFHMITEEIRSVITGAGLTPDHTALNQLALAIQSMIVGAQKAVVINGVTFEASVTNGKVVRWDSANSRFDEAVADGTSNNRAVGVADVTNSKVYLYGECPLFSGLTPGARYYLDASTAGAIASTAPTDAVMVGIAKSATTLWVDIDVAPQLTQSLPRTYLSGMTTATNAGSPTTKIDVVAGKCRSDDDTADIVLSATLTKQLNAAWVAGNNGGLDTGAVAANTGYHVWAIYNPTTGVSDVLFSTSASAPTMPSGFTKKRWIWYIRTDGSSLIRAYFQRGDTCLYKAPAVDVNASALSAGAGSTYTLPVPDAQYVQAIINVHTSGPDAEVYVHSPDTDVMYPSPTSPSPIPASIQDYSSLNPDYAAGNLTVWTNGSAQVRVDGGTSQAQTVSISTLGWISMRGRNN